MTLHSQQVVCNAVNPTLLYPPDEDGVELTIRAAGVVYLGNGDLSVDNGYQLAKDTNIHLSLGPGELVYGLGDAVTVYILATKNG